MAEHADHPAYPVGLRLSGRRVVIVGGGQVAQRRLPALIATGADITLVSPSATPSVEAMADAGEIRWERRRYEDGDLADTWYALVASTDAAANDAASAEAERTRTWCVRSDDAEAATAWTPATGRSEGITIAVLTTTSQGRDPATPPPYAMPSSKACATAPSPPRTTAPGPRCRAGRRRSRRSRPDHGPWPPPLAEADVVIADRLGPGTCSTNSRRTSR
ncbi:NAD(P)-dependent oxidoreductase [Streptomyces sp. M10(2022)]